MTEPRDPPWPPAWRGWLAVAALTAAYVLSFTDRQILSLLVPAIQHDLGLSDLKISLLQGLAFGVFYTVLGVPIGWLADRASRRAIIATSSVLWSVMTAACGLAQTYVELFLARAGVGIGEAALNPAALSMLADYFPAHRRTLPISVYVASGSLGGGLALIIGGGVIAWAERLGTTHFAALGTPRGWQWVFMLVGVIGLIVPLLFLFVREPERRGARERGQAASRGELLAFLRRNRSFLLRFVGGFALFSTLVYGLISWTPTFFIRRFGWSAPHVGVSYGVVYLVAGVAGSLAGGGFAERQRAAGQADATLRTVALGALGIIVPALLFAHMPTPTLALAFAGLTIFFVSFPSGVAAAALQEITPGSLRGRVTALYYLSINIVGLSLGASSVALITDKVFHQQAMLPWSLSIVTVVFGPLAAWLIVRSLAFFPTSPLKR